VFILSGDGDYIRLVDFLIRNEKFGGEYFSSLEEKGPLGIVPFVSSLVLIQS